MDPIQDLYKSWVREEVESPEVQNAREAFLNERFNAAPVPSSPWGFAFSPSFRLAMVGCLALLVLVKVGAFEPTPKQIPQTIVATTEKSVPVPAEIKVEKPIAAKTASLTAQKPIVRMSNIQIKKLSSQMGATVTYQKHFPDAQITVLWVLPKGV